MRLQHVEAPAPKVIKRHRGTFLTDVETRATNRKVVILEQVTKNLLPISTFKSDDFNGILKTYVEGMRLWARDVGKWNEEIQKVFLWNKNMVRVVFRLVEILDDRVNFEEYHFFIIQLFLNQLINK